MADNKKNNNNNSSTNNKTDNKTNTTKIEQQEVKLSTNNTGRIALVTGGNRGIGFAIVDGLSKDSNNTVIFTSRKDEDGEKALKQFSKLGRKNVQFRRLDLENSESIEPFIQNILKEFHHVDLLINNAGIYSDGTVNQPVSASSSSITEINREHKVNTIGPVILISGFLPKMKENNFGRIINVSSTLGSLSTMSEDKTFGPITMKGDASLGYKMSKAALNAVSRVFAAEVRDKNILINSMCPGYVKTDMSGGENSYATRTPDEGADTVLWLASSDENGPRGGFFRDRKQIDW